MALERRAFGRSGRTVSELGLSVGPSTPPEALRAARAAGVDLFHVERSEDLPRLAELLGPVEATLLVGTGMPPIGGAFRADSPDAHLRLESFSPLVDQPGALGPFQVLGGWEIGVASPAGVAGRLDLAGKLLADGTHAAVAAAYHPAEQQAGFEFFRGASRAGAGVLAWVADPTDPAAWSHLAKPGRTLRQASIQFVLANQYVSAALVRLDDPASLPELLAAPESEPLTLSELERIIEQFIHRGEPCTG